MKSALTKKIIIIFSVLITIVLAAVIVAFATGNTKYPSLSNPDGIFYERLDGDGNVLYTITNKELYEKIKENDGLQQLTFLVDTKLLEDYLTALTDQEIQDKIKKLKYGTSDDTEIAELDAETKTKLENDFELNMVLSGYDGKEAEYASLILAREAYVREKIVDNEDVTDLEIAKEYINNTFEDIQAIRIRFMSAGDATNVLRKFNLLTYNSLTLREYNGYTYNLETLLDPDDEIVEAYITVNPYHYDDDENILDLNEKIIYTAGEGGAYTDDEDNEYYLDQSGNLVEEETDEVKIEFTLLFDTLEDAETYKENNTTYYSVSKTDPFDEDEDVIVRDQNNDLAFTIDPDGKIYDQLGVDVTTTTRLYVNKVYEPIENVSRITLNNSTELTDQEILDKFIEMYNYVYGLYRPALPANATVEDLVALDDEFLTFNYDDVNTAQSSLAAYMFKTMDLTDTEQERYTATAKNYAGANDTNFYLIYKLTQPDKYNAEEEMLDNIESQIIIPTTIGDDITLPTTGWYGSTISWTPESTTYITNKGVVTRPDEDTAVTLDYLISFNGSSRSGSVDVTILAEGNTIEVEPSTDEEITFKSMLENDTLYNELRDKLVEEIMTASTSADTISEYLVGLRQEYGFKIYDYYLALQYTQVDADYDRETKGDKENVATLTGRPGAEDLMIAITADDLYEYAMGKNPSLYTMYASMYKELITSDYFEQIFGTETDLIKNKSERMAEMIDYVEEVKDYYPYLQSLYASYNIDFPYDSFQDYIYLEHNYAKNETDLLKNAVTTFLQPYMISETIDEYDLIELIYPTIEEYFDNYFSLNVTHLLMYFDFDEDGENDDYFDYVDTLDSTAHDQLETLKAAFETAIHDYLGESENTFESLVTDYRAASREDETWGEFKQNGFCLMQQDLNEIDDNDVSHSLTYSGEYGVHDTYVPEFVDALVLLYKEYNLPQNIAKNELYSQLVATVHGVHLIKVTQGDDFDQYSTKFAEEDPENPAYTVGLENTEEKPTLEQIRIYAEYYFLDQLYDLEDTDVEEKYDITVPKIPASMRTAIEFYAGDLISSLYVIGTLNINQADRIQDGTFYPNEYVDLTADQLVALLQETSTAYYDALFATYE